MDSSTKLIRVTVAKAVCFAVLCSKKQAMQSVEEIEGGIYNDKARLRAVQSIHGIDSTATGVQYYSRLLYLA